MSDVETLKQEIETLKKNIETLVAEKNALDQMYVQKIREELQIKTQNNLLNDQVNKLMMDLKKLEQPKTEV